MCFEIFKSVSLCIFIPSMRIVHVCENICEIRVMCMFVGLCVYVCVSVMCMFKRAVLEV